MALNIKDSDAERLAAEVAALADETKTGAIKVALQERQQRLARGMPSPRSDGPLGEAEGLSFLGNSSARSKMRVMSKTLFGNLDRLEVAVAIAASLSGAINASELGRLLGIAPNRVAAQLAALTKAGLLEPLPRASQIRWYMRRDSAFWQLCRELQKEWVA